MKRESVKTCDGSYTVYVPELGEHYHSQYGAVTESEHIFIRSAFMQHKANPVRVIEFGMGTGLNVLLTRASASGAGREVYYHAVEKYPVSATEMGALLPQGFTDVSETGILKKIHEGPWETVIQIEDGFTLFKERADFRDSTPSGLFDVIYFDAFAPDVQPQLWTPKIFSKIFSLASPGAILTTYSSKGTVRRNLLSAGFNIEKLAGPPGKREITRAVKPAS